MDDTPSPEDADRYLAVIRILIEAMLAVANHPDTRMDQRVGERFAADIEFASTLMGVPK